MRAASSCAVLLRSWLCVWLANALVSRLRARVARIFATVASKLLAHPRVDVLVDIFKRYRQYNACIQAVVFRTRRLRPDAAGLTPWHRATDFCLAHASAIAERTFRWLIESSNLSSAELQANARSCATHALEAHRGVWHTHNFSAVHAWSLARRERVASVPASQ